MLIYFLPTMIGITRKVEGLGLLIFLNVAADRCRTVRRDGDGIHAAPPRAAADLYPVPVSPVPAGPERPLVTAAGAGQAAILAGAACPWRYR